MSNFSKTRKQRKFHEFYKRKKYKNFKLKKISKNGYMALKNSYNLNYYNIYHKGDKERERFNSDGIYLKNNNYHFNKNNNDIYNKN